MSDFFVNTIQHMVLLPAQFYNEPFEVAFKAVSLGILNMLLTLLVPLIVVTAIAAIAGNLLQFGFLFAPESIKPDIKKISPIGGFKKIFALKNLIEFIKSVIKIVFLSFVVYYVISDSLNDLIIMPHCGSRCLMPVAAHLIKRLLLYSVAAFIVIAVLDYLFERYNFERKSHD